MLMMPQDMMKYDPQQRPTASQSLQYPYFQVNNQMPVPESNNPAPAAVPTYTRRPIGLDNDSSAVSVDSSKKVSARCAS